MKKTFWIGMIPFLCAAPAVAMGSIVMHLRGVSLRLYGQNIAALILGGAISFFCIARPRRTEPRGVFALMLLSVGGLLWTFASPALDGVHRWVEIGPVSLNGAFIFLPMALVAIHGLWSQGKPLPALLAMVAIAAMLFLQPDASMVTAFTLAVIPVLLRGDRLGKLRVGLLALLCVLTVLSWMKRDSLEPVDYVEGILQMARDCGKIYVLAGIASLLILFFPFGMGAAYRERRVLCISCALFYLGTLVGAAAGAFPVPVMGYGVSPIVGYLILASVAVRSFGR